MARNVEWIFLQGKASWAQRLFNPDLEFKCWSVQLHLNQESYDKFLKLKESEGKRQGILNEIKKDEDGYYVNLKRPTEKQMKGTLVSFSPPEILQADGKTPWDREKMIGNGSDVTVKLECYGYNRPAGGTGRAIRLVSVRVDNLVPYEKERDMSTEQQKVVQGMDEQPKQLF